MSIYYFPGTHLCDFGEKLRKAKMDAGLQIKELASRLGVTEATVIKWEVRGMRPMSREVRAILNEFILKNQLIN